MQKTDAVSRASLVSHSPLIDTEVLIKAGSCIYDWKDTLFKVGVLFLLFRSLEGSQNFAPVLCGFFLLNREQDFSSNWRCIAKEIESTSQKLTDISSSFSKLLEREETLQEEQRKLNVKWGHLQKEQEEDNARQEAIQTAQREANQVQERLNREFRSILEAKRKGQGNF